MSGRLHIAIGQHSESGVKPVNQDFHGAVEPQGHLLVSKGVALALADGISSSPVSQFASAAAVRSSQDRVEASPSATLAASSSALSGR